MDCRQHRVINLEQGFEQYDVILTKEQSVLTKIMSFFERENIRTQYNVLGCDLYFHDYKLAIEIDENGNSDRKIGYEIKRKKQ